jgi:hypothetical protein
MITLRKQEINQEDLTSECWLVQFYGLDYCKNRCELYKTQDCGGENIISTGLNRNGKKVPLGYEEYEKVPRHDYTLQNEK